MANELKLTWSISIDKEPPLSAPAGMNIFNQMNSSSTGRVVHDILTASHSAKTQVPLGSTSGNCAYFAYNNPSPTETVNVYTDGTTGPVFAELRPGTSGVQPVPAGITPYAGATGSIDVDIEYLISAR